MRFIRENLKNIITWIFVISIVGVCVYYFTQHIEFSLEDNIVGLWNTYVADWGYVILFFWSILEGELGLIFAGIASHTGHMNVFLAIFIAGLGGFVGDQIYFYIGRFNKNTIQKQLANQRRKLALAHLLLQKYGWGIIFIQRYMYGMRTIIPMSIGITRYSAIKFAIINLLSAWVWAAITILLAWFFGEEFLKVLHLIKDHPYVLIIMLVVFLGGVLWYFRAQSAKKIDKKIEKLQHQLKDKKC